jgi:hypothetical protein
MESSRERCRTASQGWVKEDPTSIAGSDANPSRRVVMPGLYTPGPRR